MAGLMGIPKAAQISLNDLIDNCAEIKPGMEVLLLAHRDGLAGTGPNIVDEEAVAWTTSMVEARGANCTVMWIEEPDIVHHWRYPPVVKGAAGAADILLNFSSTLTNEEIEEFRMHMRSADTWNVRVFATTAPLLMSRWAQTPYELVSMIRHCASKPFMQDNTPFIMTDPNGTHLEGKVVVPTARGRIPGVPYGRWRRETGRYVPWPEWVHTQIRCQDVNGIYRFDRMLSWWSVHIGIDPVWQEPVTVEVKDSRIVSISGGPEAAKIRAFLQELEGKVGDKIWAFDTFHFGVHPNAKVSLSECSDEIKRRVIDHSNSCNLHWHLGSAPANDSYPYWVHITADIRHATLKVGDTLVYDNGYLCALDDPEVIAVAQKYPDRPGLPGHQK